MALALRRAARASDYAAETVDPEKSAEVFKTRDEVLRVDPRNVIALRCGPPGYWMAWIGLKAPTERASAVRIGT
jgi:hypothetical protein